MKIIDEFKDSSLIGTIVKFKNESVFGEIVGEDELNNVVIRAFSITNSKSIEYEGSITIDKYVLLDGSIDLGECCITHVNDKAIINFIRTHQLIPTNILKPITTSDMLSIGEINDNDFMLRYRQITKNQTIEDLIEENRELKRIIHDLQDQLYNNN